MPEDRLKTLLARLAGLASAIAAASALAQAPTIELAAGIHLIHAEVANTLESRTQGLMFRKYLGPNEGMLFVFPQAEPHCFWMRNTLIPLSIAFLDADGKIVNTAEMQPLTENTHCAAAPVKFALEMTRGWFAAKGLKPGASVLGVSKAPAAR